MNFDFIYNFEEGQMLRMHEDNNCTLFKVPGCEDDAEVPHGMYRLTMNGITGNFCGGNRSLIPHLLNPNLNAE